VFAAPLAPVEPNSIGASARSPRRSRHELVPAMKFPQLKLPMKRATGVCVGDNRVTVAVCEATLRGSTRIDAFELAFGRGGPLEALQALARDPRISETIAFGFDPRRELGATMRLSPAEMKLSVSDLLEARLGRVEGGIVGARTPIQLRGGPWAHVTALPKSSAATALEAFPDADLRRTLLLPVAHELHRAAMRLTRGPRSWRTKLRILPSKMRGMAVLSAGSHPLAWRLFPWQPSDPIAPIEAAVRLLSSHARDELGIEVLDGVIVHCGFKHESFAEKCSATLGMPALTGDLIIVDDALVAWILAASALSWQPGDVNLFEDLLPPLGLRENFPTAAAATLCTVMLSAGGLLYAGASRTAEDASLREQSIRTDDQGRALTSSELAAEHADLAGEVALARKFIVECVAWSPLLKELPSLLPTSVTLTGFDGRSELDGFDEHASSDANRAVIMGETDVDRGASAPPEARMLTSRVRESALFQRSFPDVGAAKVRLKPGAAKDVAEITVSCQPKGG
jgi:hypothetical protein